MPSSKSYSSAAHSCASSEAHAWVLFSYFQSKDKKVAGKAPGSCKEVRGGQIVGSQG